MDGDAAGPAPALAGESHVSIVTRREFASSVVEAIAQVVTAVRAGTPPGVPGGDPHG